MGKPLDVVSSGRGKASVRHAPLDVIGGMAGKASVIELKRPTVDPWDKIATLRPARKQIPVHARTIQEYAKVHGIGKDTARRELNDLVAAKVLDTEIKIRGGHLERLYWPT